MTEKQIFGIYSLTTIVSASRQIASFEHLYKNYELFLNEHLEDEIQKGVDKINEIGVDTFTDEKKLFWDKINIDFLTHLKHKIVYSSELWNLLTKCVQNIHKYIFNKV